MKFLLLLITSIVVAASISLEANAANPPKEFMELDACAPLSNGSCTLDELVNIGFKNLSKRWESTATDVWILHLNGHDLVSNTDIKINFVFQKTINHGFKLAEAIRAVTFKRNALGQEVSFEGNALSLLMPFTQAVAQETGRENKLAKVTSADDQKKSKNLEESSFKKLLGTYSISYPEGESHLEAPDDKIRMVISAVGPRQITGRYSCRVEKTINRRLTRNQLGYFEIKANLTYREIPENWQFNGEITGSGCSGTIKFINSDQFNVPQADIQSSCCIEPPIMYWKSKDTSVTAFEKEAIDAREKVKMDDENIKTKGERPRNRLAKSRTL